MAPAAKNPPNAGDARDSGSVPGSGRPSAEGHPLQYSCLENYTGRGDWRATKSLSMGCKESDVAEHARALTHTDTHTHTHTHTRHR